MKIAIIGCGFSGTSLAANLHRLSDRPLELLICDKSAQFGVGDAYRTPYPFHLLNVRAHDMSAFADEPHHFLDWLTQDAQNLSLIAHQENLAQQFVPRMLYRHYLQHLLQTLNMPGSATTVSYIAEEIVNILPDDHHALVVTKSGATHVVDKVVFAIGNNPAAAFPFSITNTNAIHNPWDYQAPAQIAPYENVLLVGTGLSMIDTVLTLEHQKHQGKIYALSRHGLLPLPHSDAQDKMQFDITTLPRTLLSLMSALREQSECYRQAGGDWRQVITTLRPHLRDLWQRLSIKDKRRFLRHVLSYWNVHRHRVPENVHDLLMRLQAQQRLHIIAGRVTEVINNRATIIRRHHKVPEHININWVMNCLGPRLSLRDDVPQCVKHLYESGEITLDPLQLGFATNEVGAIHNKKGIASTIFYSLASPTKGVNWECTAVPDIRKQSYALAQYLTQVPNVSTGSEK